MVIERLMANCLSKAQRQPEKDSRPLARWWAVAGLTLFAATWKLWTPQTEFPQVPLFVWAGSLPLFVDWMAFGVLLGSLMFATWNPNSRRSWLAFVASLSVLIVLDQHRLQPWAWQLLLMAIVYATFQASGERQPHGSIEPNQHITGGLTPNGTHFDQPERASVRLGHMNERQTGRLRVPAHHCTPQSECHWADAARLTKTRTEETSHRRPREV